MLPSDSLVLVPDGVTHAIISIATVGRAPPFDHASSAYLIGCSPMQMRLPIRERPPDTLANTTFTIGIRWLYSHARLGVTNGRCDARELDPVRGEPTTAGGNQPVANRRDRYPLASATSILRSLTILRYPYLPGIIGDPVCRGCSFDG